MKLSLVGRALHRYPEDWENHPDEDWIEILEDFPQRLEKERQRVARESMGLTIKQYQDLMGELRDFQLYTQVLAEENADPETVEAARERLRAMDDNQYSRLPAAVMLKSNDAVADFDVKHYLKGWSFKDADGQLVPINDETIANLTEAAYDWIAGVISLHRASKLPGAADQKNSVESSGSISGDTKSPTASQKPRKKKANPAS